MSNPATVGQAAILVGGLGTRLGSLAAETPKPLLPVGDRSHLAWLLRELCRYGVQRVLLLAGHHAERVHAALPGLQSLLPRALDIAVVQEPRPAGTGGALRHARAQLEPRFWLLNGDSLFDTNLAALLADAAADPPEVEARLLLHRTRDPDRYGVVTTEGDRVTGFTARPAGGNGAQAINAGVAILSVGVAERCGPDCSLEADIYPALAGAGVLRATLRDGWFIDIGVPDALARARMEIPRRLLGRPALILDRDGVLNVDHGYVGSRDRLEWIPGALAAVREAADRGWHVFVATNQSGVARGYFDEAAVQALLAHMADTLRGAGGTLDDVRYAPTHPQGSVAAYAREDDWRKPGPGMIQDLLRAWQLDPGRCVMLGDQPTDLAAAAAAGIAGAAFSGGNLHDRVTALLDSRTTATA